jgi:hypothetical protein
MSPPLVTTPAGVRATLPRQVATSPPGGNFPARWQLTMVTFSRCEYLEDDCSTSSVVGLGMHGECHACGHWSIFAVGCSILPWMRPCPSALLQLHPCGPQEPHSTQYCGAGHSK